MLIYTIYPIQYMGKSQRMISYEADLIQAQKSLNNMIKESNSVIGSINLFVTDDETLHIIDKRRKLAKNARKSISQLLTQINE